METQFKKSSKLKRAIQKKAFTAWANSILKKRNQSSTKIDDLYKSLRNGQLLGKLIENLSDEKVRRLSPVKSRQQSIDNVEICLDFLEEKRVSTRGIDSEDIVDGCPDTTLELMWSIITELYINKKELLKKGKNKTVEEALLLWAQDKTNGYRDVRVKDFTSSSWKDGLAFLALINAHRPKIIHFKDFHNDERRHNLKTAFDEAEDELGIPPLLDVEDMMKSQVDERSVAAYVACFYKRFADKRRRRSRSESRSDDSDTSSSSETSLSGGNKPERKRRSRSTSKTRRSSGNKHKQRGSSQSRSSSSSSESSAQCKGRRGLTKESERDRSSSSTASSSSERSNTRRGSKNRRSGVRSRNSSNSGSTPETRKYRKGFRNISEKGTRKSISPERTRSDGKRRKSVDTQRRTDRSLSRTRNRKDRQSHSRERKYSLDRSLSRTRNRKDRQSHSRERKYSSDRSLSRTRNRRGRRSLSRERKSSSDRSLSRTRNFRDRRSLSRERNLSSNRSFSQTRHGRNRRTRSYSNSPDRRGVKNKGNRGRFVRSPSSSRNMSSYKGDFPVRDRIIRSWSSSSQEDEYHRTGGFQVYTLSKKQSQKDFHSYQPIVPDNLSEIRKEILNPKRHPGFSRNDPSQGEDMEPIKQFLRKKKKNSQTVPLTVSSNPSPVQFEWQFQDEHGAWITYGKSNSAGNGSNATTTTSDDIENHFVANPNSPPISVQTKHNRYVLDFQNMTQKNMKTNVKRLIRRIPKLSANITPITAHTFPRTVVPMNPAPVSFEWQFQDEHGSWITYGKPNSAGDVSYASLTCSDGIERHFASYQTDPASLIINSNNNTQYVLDFVGMTQTNQNSSVQRPIRRIQKQSPNITPVNLSRGLNLGAVANANILHEWQFEDEHGSWITYGKPNSAGNVSHITTTCSDDIEKHYVSNPVNLTPLTINSKNNAQYVLDLKNMTQTNQQTSVQRKIRRVPKASPSSTAIPKGSTFVWSFKDEHGNWIKYGETSSSNDATSATTATSDDIETKYARNPTASLEIASGHHKYIIDFNAMTQTNINTNGTRAIRRQLVTPSDLPSNWTPMNASDKGLRVVALSATDTDYTNQVSFVKKTLPASHTISKVFRIQNEHLWKDFMSRKKRLKERNPQIKYKEVYLFHGTDPKHVQSICAENLDFRLNGTNGTVYGKGTYFATSAAYSARFAGSGPTKLMFIVKVLIGHYTVGNTNLRRPPKDASGVFYDATVDNQANPTIYVKYDNTEYYPEYYIEFT